MRACDPFRTRGGSTRVCRGPARLSRRRVRTVDSAGRGGQRTLTRFYCFLPKRRRLDSLAFFFPPTPSFFERVPSWLDATTGISEV